MDKNQLVVRRIANNDNKLVSVRFGEKFGEMISSSEFEIPAKASVTFDLDIAIEVSSYIECYILTPNTGPCFPWFIVKQFKIDSGKQLCLTITNISNEMIHFDKKTVLAQLFVYANAPYNTTMSIS